tara:strand:- start:2307 stop:3032 length:726 start_codon:yes stop_codon:yes gene_type:complete
MNVPALARAPRGVSRASTSSPSFTNQIRRRHPRARPTSRGFDDIDAIAETADEDDYTKWQRTEPDAQAWKNYADAQGEGGSFTVGAKPLDEKFLSELMLALLRNHRRGLRAEVLLHKVRSNMELDGYKSLLVGVGRMEMWELAREIIDFVKAEGRERGDEVVTSNWFMALAGRRLEEKAYDATCDVFGYMREFGSVPSGETIEVFAKLTVRVGAFPSTSLRERFVDDYTPSKTPSFGSESH